MRYLLTALAFIAIGLTVLLLVPARQPLKPVENRQILPVESAHNIRDVTPDTALPGPDVSGNLLSRLPAKIKPKAKAIQPLIQKYKNLIVSSAGVLGIKDITIQIRDLNPLKLDAICQTVNDEPWPCGRFASTDLKTHDRVRTT